MLGFVAYVALIGAYLIATSEESTSDPAPPFALGLALVPFMYAALAFISRHRNAPIAVLKSMGVWLVTALAFGLASIPVGLSFAFSVGGIFSLRAEEHQSYRYRFAASAIQAVAVLALFISPPLALSVAATMPFVVLAWADNYADRREQRAAEEV